MTLGRILLPVDGSGHARRAAELAGMLAGMYDSEVVVLHVLDPGRLSEEHTRMVEVEHGVGRQPEELPWVANVPAELVAMLSPREARETQEQKLHRVAEKVVGVATDILEQQGVPRERIRVVFRDGRPARAILNTINDQDVQTVVMGSRGLSAAGGMVLGSVSHRIASLAPCTVITAR